MAMGDCWIRKSFSVSVTQVMNRITSAINLCILYIIKRKREVRWHEGVTYLERATEGLVCVNRAAQQAASALKICGVVDVS